MKPLIPLYDLSYSADVLAAAKTKPVSIIINVADGPGSKLDPAWKRLTDQLHATAATLYGYIDLVTWHNDKSTPKTLAQLYAETQLWSSLYSIRTNYFYDDWQSKITCPNPPFANCSIANPGCDTATACDTTLVHESVSYSRSKPSQITHQAVFCMAEPDYRQVLELAKKRGVELFYAVSAPDDWHAYDKLPSYFNQMIKDI